MKKNLDARFGLMTALVLGAAAMRLVPHIPNFTPVAALALFGGARFEKKFWDFALPLTAMLLSDVLLELIAIEDDRMRRAVRVRRRVANREHRALAIGRPRIVVDPILHGGELVRLASIRGEEPQLVGVVRIAARGEKRDRMIASGELR